MKLSDLKNNETGVIIKVKGYGAFRKRIIEMGFVKGKEIRVIKPAPLLDPVEYQILDYKVSLRNSEAELIEVITKKEAEKLAVTASEEPSALDHIFTETISEKQKTINVALIGNPNCGKTTLFNFASRSREHVGNYNGVTVDSKTALFKKEGYEFVITDLPGTYSLSAYSAEELYVRRFLTREMPDVVINVVDASNLERNLYLTTQLIDMDVKVVIALNMYDELQKKNVQFNYLALSRMLGIPIVPTISSRGKGIERLFKRVVSVYEDNDPVSRRIKINHGSMAEDSVRKLEEMVAGNEKLKNVISPRFVAVKMLEKDINVQTLIKPFDEDGRIQQKASEEISKIEENYDDDSESVMIDLKYGFVAGALKKTYVKTNKVLRRQNSEIADRLITHKVLGFPVFLLFMWFMFQATFSLGEYPMNWIDQGIMGISNFLQNAMPEGSFKDLLIDGIIAGVGGVLVFLPNILILFFFISLMEDTGYMARAVFIMDKLMNKIGLHGKSFIPLIMGFGCNVPAIMATRAIENRSTKIITILVNPLMSCSARLPVYILIVGSVFPTYSGTVLFGIYLLGILLAITLAKLFSKYLFKEDKVPFVMELPPYRVPTIKAIIKHMWFKGQEYLKKMGGIILIASIIIWSLNYFPRNMEYSRDYENEIATLNKKSFNASDEDKALIQEEIDHISALKTSEKQQNSYIGRLGNAVQPIMEPLGFNWKMTVSIITGIAAKEVVVSTLGVLYQEKEASESSVSLQEKLKNDKHLSGIRKGENVYSISASLAFMVFILIYFPCVAVIAAVKKETHAWKWALFLIVYTCSLAWIMSFITFNITELILKL